MFAKKKFSQFPEFQTTGRRGVFAGSEWGYWLVNLGLLFFAVWFWVSAVMRLFLGTDYFFDVMFYNMGANFWGNLAMVSGVVFMPGLGVGYNGIEYMRSKRIRAVWMGGVCFGLLAMGFLATVIGRQS